MNVSSVMNAALSGMRTQTNKVSAIASNVANISTPGNGRTDPDTLTADEGQSVDPAMELTGLIQAEQSFKANAVVFETGADMWDLLMSIKRD
ncbi:flagellar basal body protein [Rhizobium mongolense]|uniref:Flagellar basal-body rod protein FlgC n=1 Tax=Rhizobium mongolense TaxID=57676 RepID=A0A7W6WHR6_9HYPH|nr:flagellar basal body protein [Rhizobium mongolense]MBB4278300.1 flagellar basal-body rod protein FlgC [Rhizobium mongolense]